MRPIDADTLIVELEKDEVLFDKEAEEARKNPNNCTEGYADAMWSRANGIRDAIVEVYDAPTIDIDRPKGEWIDMGGYEVCKDCHEVKRFPHWNFCPNCGADMRKEQTMTMHDLVVAFAKGLEEEGVTDEELERIIHDAEEEVRKEIARMKGADDEVLRQL